MVELVDFMQMLWWNWLISCNAMMELVDFMQMLWWNWLISCKCCGEISCLHLHALVDSVCISMPEVLQLKRFCISFNEFFSLHN